MAASALSTCSCCFGSSSSGRLVFSKYQNEPKRKQSLNLFRSRTSSDDSDCNTEECAPDKEVGKVSVEWLAGDKTKVVGTFPPGRRGWTGYVEKDTAGQTNIYSVEPAVYVAESAISSGTAGSTADGSENTVAVVASLALISVAAASAILLQVGKNPPQVQTVEYAGPSLSYYINKLKATDIIEASALPVESSSTQVSEASVSVEASTSPETSSIEVSEVDVQSEPVLDASSSTSNSS